ncbi:MAG: hypothetical protein IPM64_00270 [Phycisphaerales bacterium]|nr:hypothetical protein [Phycisphaerales bacterium]
MAQQSGRAERPAPSGADILRGLALPVGFLLLAGAFWFSPRAVNIPTGTAAAVDPAALVAGPRRVGLTDPAQILVEGRMENCNACHQIFASARGGSERLSYHTDIRLDHGLNDRCVNCHDADNRELLTLRDGATVPYAQTPVLCAQCHGTVYRDWQNGTHGKTLGSWITGSAAQRRLSCNECHDPHAPRYPAYEPLPAPRTLRMGEPAARPHTDPHAGGPLQRWRTHPPQAHNPEAHDTGGTP